LTSFGLTRARQLLSKGSEGLLGHFQLGDIFVGNEDLSPCRPAEAAHLHVEPTFPGWTRTAVLMAEARGSTLEHAAQAPGNARRGRTCTRDNRQVVCANPEAG
jgi:hypothetical protein